MRKKLYSYYEDCGRMGAIEGLFLLTDEQKAKYMKYTDCLQWDELLGKHSEGTFQFDDARLTEIELPAEVCDLLFEKIGQVLSGPFDFDYFDEMIVEMGEEDDDE